MLHGHQDSPSQVREKVANNLTQEEENLDVDDNLDPATQMQQVPAKPTDSSSAQASPGSTRSARSTRGQTSKYDDFVQHLKTKQNSMKTS